MNLYVAPVMSLLLAVAITIPSPGQDELSPEPFLEKAMQAAKEQRRDEAIDQLNQAVALGEGSDSTLLAAGNLFAAMGDLPRAEELLQKALALNGAEKSAVLQALARIRVAENKVEEATRLLEQVLELDPADVNAHLQLFNIEASTDALELSEARIQQLEIDKKAPTHVTDYLRGSLYCLQGKWREAAESLESALPNLVDPTMQTVAYLRLSQAYELLGEHDRRLNSLEEVIKLNPENEQFKWFEIQALLALKRTEEALAKYEAAEERFRETAKQPGNEQFLVQQAQMEMLQQAQLPRTKRTYGDLERLLFTIDDSERIPDTVKKQLRALFYEKTGRLQEAQNLRAQINELSEEDGLTLMMKEARQMAQQPNGEQATIKHLDAAREQFGDSVRLRVVRAAILTDLRTEQYIENIKSLANNTDDFSDVEKFQLLSQIGTLLLAEGEVQAAADVWTRAAEAAPDNLDLAMRLFDVMLILNDKEEIMKRGLALRDLAGQRSAIWKWARASRIVSQVRRGELEMDALAEAKTLVKDAIAERDGWEQLYRLQGDIYVVEGDEANAAKAYARAIDLGSTNVKLHRALIRLYYTQGKLADAERILRRLPRSKWQLEEQNIAKAIRDQQ